MISLFIYGVLDSADGAQARRLGCSSPLGELLDHGLDSLTMGEDCLVPFAVVLNVLPCPPFRFHCYVSVFTFALQLLQTTSVSLLSWWKLPLLFGSLESFHFRSSQIWKVFLTTRIQL